MRWVIEMGSQRGMRIGGVPVVDILVIIVIVVGGLLLANQGPEMVSATNTQLGANTTATRDRELELPSVTPLLVSYLFGPMVVALVTGIIADRPRLLDYIIVNDPPLTFADYAKQEGIDEKVLAEENGFDSQKLPGLQFGQRLKLPPR